MTGTPVQNGLQDLRALTRWLRFYPFDSSHNFKKFIMTPLSKHEEKGLVNLRDMMRVCQIRRMKADMRLSPIVSHTITVVLTDQERNQYKATLIALQENLADQSRKDTSRSTNSVLQAIRDLRRICCDGLALQIPLPLCIAEPAIPDLIITCSGCGAVIKELLPRPIFHRQCGHVLCEACYYSSVFDSDDEEANILVGACCQICGAMAEETTVSSSENVLSARSCPVGEISCPLEPITGTFVSAKIAYVVSKLSGLYQMSSERNGKRSILAVWILLGKLLT